MSWECHFLDGTHCNRRNKECDPGDRGCVLEGKFYFLFDERKNQLRKPKNEKEK